MPKNRQHYRKIKYPDKVTKQNALYLSGYFYLVLWEVEMLISRQPLFLCDNICKSALYKGVCKYSQLVRRHLKFAVNPSDK